MKVTENPIQPGTLAKLHELTGGHKGVVFLLENTTSEKLVVKFQNEAPVEAIAATRIMEHVRATTPTVRKASDIDLERLSFAVESVGHHFPNDRSAFQAAKERFKHVLLMDFAEGNTLKEARKNQVQEFLQVLCDQDFQVELGKIVAADTFAGNPDRMFAGYVGYDNQLKGWYHEQNLLLSSTRKPIAIDNAFDPQVVTARLPWGCYVAGQGIQWGSIASAYLVYAKKEAKLLFNKFLDTAANDHPNEQRAIDGVRKQHRATFVDNFTQGATQAMQVLLTRGQHWKQSLTDCGADAKLLEAFRFRKRLLRQVSKGVAPENAEERARNDEEYRKWVLTSEFGLNEPNADELLKKGVDEYKRFKASNLIK